MARVKRADASAVGPIQVAAQVTGVRANGVRAQASLGGEVGEERIYERRDIGR
jgi:hypothetical protein